MDTKNLQWTNQRISALLKPIIKRFKKHFLITTLIAIGCLFSTASLAATSLSDTELAGVSGGGIDPLLEGQVLPQEQQQPDNNGSGYAPSQSLTNNDGMELAPEIFTILQSTSYEKRDRRIVLDGMTQQGAKALNLENVLSSDTISTNNIFDGGSITLNDVTTGLEVNQLNDLSQLHRSQGSLSLAISGYGYEAITLIKSGTENYDKRIYFSIDQHDQFTTLSLDEREWNVAVGKVNFADQFTEDRKVFTILHPVTIELIEGGKIGVIVKGLWGDKYGAEAEYTGLFLEGPSASFNDMELYGPNDDDLLIDATARLGYINFGIFKATGCVVKCGGFQADLGDLEILNLFEFLARIDPAINGVGFTKEGIILEGMGSAFGDDLNLNTGFAFVGNGYLKVIEPSSINTKVEFNLNVDAGLEFTLDLSGIDLGLFKPWPKTWTWPDAEENDNGIIDLEIDFTLLNIEGDIYDMPFDGEFIVKLGPGDVTASSDVSNNPVETEEDSLLVFDMDITDIGDSSYSEFYEHTIFIGGQMTGAEAELLALSEGNLSVDNNSIVSLTDSAQQNIRVFNGVNAVSSVSANALNISRLPGLSVLPQILMQQHNVFIQQR